MWKLVYADSKGAYHTLQYPNREDALERFNHLGRWELARSIKLITPKGKVLAEYKA